MGAWRRLLGRRRSDIEADDRNGLERLLRYCARPAFALERLREIDPGHLVYESVKPGPGGNVSLLLTPMQLLDRLAALIPPPRRHRHRYIGVLAPNSPLRAAVTALAQPVGEVTVTAAADPAPHTGPLPPDEATTDEPPHRKAARYVWASLLARIYEVLPLMELLAIRLSAIEHLEEVLVPVSANSTRGCALSRWLCCARSAAAR